jgi:hypothetical protein
MSDYWTADERQAYMARKIASVSQFLRFAEEHLQDMRRSITGNSETDRKFRRELRELNLRCLELFDSVACFRGRWGLVEEGK